MNGNVVVSEVDARMYVILSKVEKRVSCGEFSWYRRMYNVITELSHRVRYSRVQLCVCVCVYACICVCVCFIYVHVCICIYIYVYAVCMYVCMCICLDSLPPFLIRIAETRVS